MLGYYWNLEQKPIYKEDDFEIYSVYEIDTKKDSIIGRYKRGSINVYFLFSTPQITDHDIDLFKKIFKNSA